MKKLLFVIVLLLLLAVAASVSACRSAPPSPTPSPTPTSTQFSAGQVVYANSCARCHGDKGQGGGASAIIGASANLGKYNTAQGLLDFIDTVMPPNAPGTLSGDQYLQVLDFLLVENNFVPAGTTLDPKTLGSIQLKKQ